MTTHCGRFAPQNQPFGLAICNHVRILDEWLVDIPSEREQHFLLELFEKRYGQWPTIFCTQQKVSEWYPRLGGGVIADAIMDRIVNSVTIDTGKVNMREMRKLLA